MNFHIIDYIHIFMSQQFRSKWYEKFIYFIKIFFKYSDDHFYKLKEFHTSLQRRKICIKNNRYFINVILFLNISKRLKNTSSMIIKYGKAILQFKLFFLFFIWIFQKVEYKNLKPLPIIK